MQHEDSIIYIGNLLGSKIVTAEGKRIGHVADIELSPGPEYKVTGLFFGRRGLLYRLHVPDLFIQKRTQESKPYKVPWNAVDRIESGTVKLKPGYHLKD